MIGYTVLPDASERFFRGDSCRNADWSCQQKRGYPFGAPSMGDDTADLKKIRNYGKTLTFYGFSPPRSCNRNIPGLPETGESVGYGTFPCGVGFIVATVVTGVGGGVVCVVCSGVGSGCGVVLTHVPTTGISPVFPNPVNLSVTAPSHR
jgi:hypothetical protein